MRTEQEIKKAIEDINLNRELLYGYREDVVAILNWVLGEAPFDGLPAETIQDEN